MDRRSKFISVTLSSLLLAAGMAMADDDGSEDAGYCMNVDIAPFHMMPDPDVCTVKDYWDGDLQQAVTALNTFLQDYDNSDLKPNAQFALGISQGGMGDIPASKKTLQIFVDDNPKHPLVADAKQVIAEIGGFTCKRENSAEIC